MANTRRLPKHARSFVGIPKRRPAWAGIIIACGLVLFPLSALADGEPSSGRVGADSNIEEAIVLAGETIYPGEKKELRLPTSESFIGANVDTPLVVIRGKEPGPVLCLVAGIHGDELNGTEIVREIMDTHGAGDIRGTLIGVPIANLFGFINQSRYLPDRRDLNRFFPGNEHGSTASRIARRFWDVLRNCTHLIDFHTGSLHRSNVPQVRGDLRNEEILDLSRAFGARVIVQNPGPQGTLRRTATDHGIAAILYEAGESMRFQKEEIRKGVLGVRNAMVHLGMREGRRVDLGTQRVYRRTRWVRAEHGGIIEIYPVLGESISEGDILGVISDPLRRDKDILVSRVSGQIIGMVLSPMVIPGMAVLHVGLDDQSLDASGMGMEVLDSDRPE